MNLSSTLETGSFDTPTISNNFVSKLCALMTVVVNSMSSVHRRIPNSISITAWCDACVFDINLPIIQHFIIDSNIDWHIDYLIYFISNEYLPNQCDWLLTERAARYIFRGCVSLVHVYRASPGAFTIVRLCSKAIQLVLIINWMLIVNLIIIISLNC